MMQSGVSRIVGMGQTFPKLGAPQRPYRHGSILRQARIGAAAQFASGGWASQGGWYGITAVRGARRKFLVV